MQHASHKSRLPDLQRIEARLRDVVRMIETERYCVDIIRELREVRANLKNIQQEILHAHIDHCLERAANSHDPAEKSQITAEVMELLESTSP